MKNFLLKYLSMIFLIIGYSSGASTERLVWPPPPDEARIEYINEIICKDLSPTSSFWGKLKQFITGKTEEHLITLPYDILVDGKKMFLTCQGIPYLIEINLSDNSFKKHHNSDYPFVYPICLCDGGDGILFITDSETQSVYRYKNGKVTRFIHEGLHRPTGITALPDHNRLYVIDTGEHNLKIFDYDGILLKTIPNSQDSLNKFHFPTFATSTNDGFILVNDALNYQIKRFDIEGNFISAFGSEGDGPGTFSRPKGLAVDSKENIYIIDNLFDNLQILDRDGRILLVVGTSGQKKGLFWSPSGIDIFHDTVYIADTYNNRIQIFHFLGDTE